LNLGRQLVDLAADVATEQLESGDRRESHESRGDRVLGKLKARFVSPEFLDHYRAPLRFRAPLFDGVRQRVDLVSDVATEQLEGCDGCERDQRRGDRVLGQLKTSFIAKESLNHLFAPLGLG
jgi:hypothetical protein